MNFCIFIFLNYKDNMGKIIKKRKSYKKYQFRLSSKQSNSLRNYCLIAKTSPNKLIKRLLKNYTEDFTDEKLGKSKPDSTQLSLFHEIKPEYKQMEMFAD